MPCNDGNWHVDTALRDNNAHWQQRVDYLSRLLCHACSRMRGEGVKMGAELATWHRQHLLEDQARERQEIARAKARQDLEAKQRGEKARKTRLANVRERLKTQLTAEEREALNLD